MTSKRHFSVSGTDHVGFAVSSLDRAIAFWTEGLGGTVIRTGRMGGAFLSEVTGAHGAEVRMAIVEVADQRIELLEYASAPAASGPIRQPYQPGMAHLALQVSDLDAAIAGIASHGWRPQGTPMAITEGPRAGTRVMYVVGPDGETIELI